MTDGPGDEELLVAPRPSRGRRYWYGGGAALLVAGVLVAVLTRGGGSHRTQAGSTGSPSRHGVSSADPAGSAGPTDSAAPVVLSRTLPVLGKVQLFVRAANAVVHLDFASGRVTTTPLPDIDTYSGTSVTFLATGTGALVRPDNAVPGYFVPDGQPARTLQGVLARAPVFPGPDSESVWVEEYTSGKLSGLRLVYVPTAAVTSRVLTLPPSYDTVVDGSGYVLVLEPNGVDDVRLDGAHRVLPAHGLPAVLAGGQDRLVVATCAWPKTTGCPAELVRLPDGVVLAHLGALGAINSGGTSILGVVAPGERQALIYQPAGPGQVAARLLDLRTGRFVGGGVTVDPNVMRDAVAFSADGHWAFVVGAGGKLVILDASTGRTQPLGVELPFVYQLAVRD